MNEVSKIHLGRQVFTVSLDAQHELKTYLDAISAQVKDKEVVEEVELRMAELLTERGISSDTVLLPSDVGFLKEQLGNPRDFQETADEPIAAELPTNDSKRLFRDTDNALVAGVAAGLAKYFGVDALLVRLLFVLFTFITVGWGILLYVLFWLLVPEAKTSSERLQMAGKPVTVRSLKAIVEDADIKSAAARANASLSGPINTFFRLCLKVVGLLLVLFGLSCVFGLIAAGTYFLTRGAAWAQTNIFPIGFRENLLTDIAFGVCALAAVFIIVFGVATFRRSWPLRAWVTGVLAGLLLLGIAIGGALTADVYPTVHRAYTTNLHTTVRQLQPFTAVTLTGMDEVPITFATSDTYSVALTYYGHPNLSPVKTTVRNGALALDASQFNSRRTCPTVCLPASYNLSLTIYTPNAAQLENQVGPDKPLPPLSAIPAPVFSN